MVTLIALLLPPRYRAASRTPAGAAAAVPWQLPPGGTCVLHLAAGDRLLVRHGRVWVTEPMDLDDHFVDAGQQHLLRRGGRVVLEAEGGLPAEGLVQPLAACPAGTAPASMSGSGSAAGPTR